MVKIVHISDLHFGTEDLQVAEALINKIDDLKPALVAVSGDLTQRARRNQFKKAAAHLEKINFPKIIVPGNHDIPLYDIIRRLLSPLGRYKKYITEDLCPVFENDKLFALGINSSRRFTWKSGFLSDEQISYMKEKFCKADEEKFKVLVTHHPFMPPPEQKYEDLINKGREAVEALSDCGIDLILAGHAHISYSADLKTFYPDSSRSFIIAQAGTAISQRHRGEPNSFNYIEAEKGKFFIAVYEYSDGDFRLNISTAYKETEGHWGTA